MRRLSIEQARRTALEAQGFTDPKPGRKVDIRHFRRVLRRVGTVQLDSVNVFTRSHYLPFFARLGAYGTAELDRWLWRSGELFEYWGHMASLIPMAHYPLFRWRMDRDINWNRAERLLLERPGYIDGVLAQVRQRGPLRTGELDDPGKGDGQGMWNWSDGKVALEMLFVQGKVTTHHRRNFVRLYDVPERVIPREHLERDSLSQEEAHVELLVQAARSLGVATADDLSDYYRIKMPQARPLIEGLVAGGQLVEVEVEGWEKPGLLHPDARIPRRVEGRALLSPFDSLVWYRPRTERLWGFHYRIEIYVPQPKRVYGYYVLPFLLDGELVARVDLKADRDAGKLLVRGAFAEPETDRARVAGELAAELRAAAEWLGMDGLEVGDKGNLASALRSAT